MSGEITVAMVVDTLLLLEVLLIQQTQSHLSLVLV